MYNQMTVIFNVNCAKISEFKKMALEYVKSKISVNLVYLEADHCEIWKVFSKDNLD